VILRLPPVGAKAQIRPRFVLSVRWSPASRTCRIMNNDSLRIIHFNILITHPALDQSQHQQNPPWLCSWGVYPLPGAFPPGNKSSFSAPSPLMIHHINSHPHVYYAPHQKIPSTPDTFRGVKDLS